MNLKQVHLKIRTYFWPREIAAWIPMPDEIRSSLFNNTWKALFEKKVNTHEIISEKRRLTHNINLVGPKAFNCAASWFGLSIIFLFLAYDLSKPEEVLFNAYIWLTSFSSVIASTFMVIHLLYLELGRIRTQN
jgi:hypothetical protein